MTVRSRSRPTLLALDYAAAIRDPARADFLNGGCVALAVALHRAFGYRLGAVLEHGHPVHVFVVDEEWMLIDACGRRPYPRAVREWDRYSDAPGEFDDHVSLAEVEKWVAAEDLYGYDSRDLAGARRFARTYLELLPNRQMGLRLQV